MNKEAQSIVVTLLGGILISITVTGRFTSYVKPGFGPLLIVAGIILVLVGVASLVLFGRAQLQRRRAARATAAPTAAAHTVMPSAAAHAAVPSAGADAHGHDHGSSRAPWLLLAPILVLLLMAPPALGAEAVTRNAGSQALAGLDGVAPASGPGANEAAGGTSGGYAFNDGSGHGEGTKAFAKKRPTMTFPALPAGKDPAIGLRDFVLRALYDGQGSVADNPVTVIGFIAPAGDGYTGGYSIARLIISCCAADANPMRLHVDGAAPLPVNTWVTAVVAAVPGSASSDNEYVPTVNVTTLTSTSQPADPYEH